MVESAQKTYPAFPDLVKLVNDVESGSNAHTSTPLPLKYGNSTPVDFLSMQVDQRVKTDCAGTRLL